MGRFNQMHSTLKKSAFPILLLLSLFSMQLILHPNSSAFDSSAKSSYGDKVKAVFLHHFLRYITWPDRDQSGPYEIIFIGDSSIIPIIESIAKKKKYPTERFRSGSSNPRGNWTWRPAISFLSVNQRKMNSPSCWKNRSTIMCWRFLINRGMPCRG